MINEESYIHNDGLKTELSPDCFGYDFNTLEPEFIPHNDVIHIEEEKEPSEITIHRGNYC